MLLSAAICLWGPGRCPALATHTWVHLATICWPLIGPDRSRDLNTGLWLAAARDNTRVRKNGIFCVQLPWSTIIKEYFLVRSYISFNNQKISKVFLKFILYCTVRLIGISLIFEFDTLEYLCSYSHPQIFLRNDWSKISWYLDLQVQADELRWDKCRQFEYLYDDGDGGSGSAGSPGRPARADWD